MKYGVGIDVSKGKSTVAILSIEGEIIEKPFEITHDIHGLGFLEDKLKKVAKIAGLNKFLRIYYGKVKKIIIAFVLMEQ